MSEFNKTITGRVYFSHVYEKRAYKKSVPKYEVTLCWDEKELKGIVHPDDIDDFIKDLEDEMSDIRDAKWKKAPRGLHWPLKENFDDEYFPDGSISVCFKSKYKPPIIDVDGLPISEDEGNEAEFYSGCYAQVLYDCFAYDKDGEGLSFEVKGIQKIKDGEPTSGGGRQMRSDEVAEAFGVKGGERKRRRRGDDDDEGDRGRSSRRRNRDRDDDDRDDDRPPRRNRRDDDDDDRDDDRQSRRSRRRSRDDDYDDDEPPRRRRRRDDD